MKKVFSTLLVLCLLVSLLPAFALETVQINREQNGIKYSIDGGEAIVHSCTAAAGKTLAIPEKIEGCPVTRILSITGSGTVKIPSGVTQIDSHNYEAPSFVVSEGNPAFSSADGMLFNHDKTVLLRCPAKKSGVCRVPDGVERVEQYAFSFCAALTGIRFPDSLIEVSSDAFFNCAFVDKLKQDSSSWDHGLLYVDRVLMAAEKEITECTIRSDTVVIMPYAFSRCQSLKSVTIPSGVKTIRYATFQSCTDLQRVTLPEGLIGIGSFAFESCRGLKEINLPESLKSIGYCAFSECHALHDVTIPAGVTSIESGGFHSDWSVSSQNTAYAVKDGLLYDQRTETVKDGVKYDKAMKTLIYCDPDKSGTLKIPEGVEEIANAACYYCYCLDNVVFPSTLKTIGSEAFYECSGLTELTLPNGLTSIGDRAFESCKNLKKINMPDSLLSVGCDVIAGTAYSYDQSNWDNGTLYLGHVLLDLLWNTDKDFQVRPGTLVVADLALGGSESAKIPASVRNIGRTLLTHSSGNTGVGLKRFEVDANNKVYASKNGLLLSKDCKTLYACPGGLHDVVIPNGVTTIAPRAFSSNDNLFSVTIPASVRTIGEGAFRDCHYLTELKLPEGIKVVQPETFWGCERLNRLYVPASVKEFGLRSLAYCSSLGHLDYGGTPDQWNQIKLYDYWDDFTGYGADELDGFQKMNIAFVGPAQPTSTPTPTPKPSAKPAAGFTDVESGAYYAEPVAWAVKKGITNGTSATTFSPNAQCTRGQVVTFLWRASGSPKATGKNPFKDVQKTDYFYDAVLWAVSKGITNGTSATTFSPNASCTRGQVVTFLYRNAGEPKVDAKSPFRDVPSGAYYRQPVLWAVKNEITNGTSADTFSPDQVCTRGQIVTFLYRGLSK